jgi:2-polyprenyl-6-methoxyphenol hydroxylase-like FAD-dependent oxidoreductase
MKRYGSDLRILIAGGGIAGLTVALALRQRGMRADIVEKAHGYGGVGYVIGLWPAGLNVLYGLGLRKALVEIGLPAGMYYGNDVNGRPLLRADFGAFPDDSEVYFLARADLIEALRKASGTPIRFGKTISTIHQSPDAIEAAFDDGSLGEYDAVIGADGLHSAVRHIAFGDVPLSYHGITGWAFWANADLGNATKEFYARGRFMGLYPSVRRACCFAAMIAPRDSSDDPATRRQRLEHAFSDFPGEALAALKSSDDVAIWHDDFLDLRLKHWSCNRVALVGDAAHAVLPTAGVGASMAIESAFVLADELSRASSEGIPSALRRYESRRRRRVDSVQKQSRQMGWMVRAGNPITAYVRDSLLRLVPSSLFMAMFRPLLYSGI